MADLGPDVIWGGPGLFQQLVFILIAGSVWALSSLLVSINPHTFESIISWQDRVSALLHPDELAGYLLIALILGAVLSLAFLLLEILIAFFKHQNASIRLRRNDFLLPVSRPQKLHALGIIILGASVEEMLFRAFLFEAFLPIWSTWLWSALLVSAIFALIHTNLQGLSASIWIFLTSLILVFIIQTTHSLFFAIFLHFSVNFYNLFVLPGLQRRFT